jgi:hypothetical protein
MMGNDFKAREKRDFLSLGKKTYGCSVGTSDWTAGGSVGILEGAVPG